MVQLVDELLTSVTRWDLFIFLLVVKEKKFLIKELSISTY